MFNEKIFEVTLVFIRYLKSSATSLVVASNGIFLTSNSQFDSTADMRKMNAINIKQDIIVRYFLNITFNSMTWLSSVEFCRSFNAVTVAFFVKN